MKSLNVSKLIRSLRGKTRLLLSVIDCSVTSDSYLVALASDFICKSLGGESRPGRCSDSKVQIQGPGFNSQDPLKISRGSGNTYNLGEVETGKPLAHW